MNDPFIVLTETKFSCKRSLCKRLSVQRGGGIPGVLDVVAWQPDLLSRACKGAQEGNKPGVGRVGGSVTGDGVAGDTETTLVMRLLEPHVNPSTVLWVHVLYAFRVPFLRRALLIFQSTCCC
jgi:hypothetical protein